MGEDANLIKHLKEVDNTHCQLCELDGLSIATLSCGTLDKQHVNPNKHKTKQPLNVYVATLQFKVVVNIYNRSQYNVTHKFNDQLHA